MEQSQRGLSARRSQGFQTRLKLHATWLRFWKEMQQVAANVAPESRPNRTEIAASLHLRFLSKARARLINCNKTRVKNHRCKRPLTLPHRGKMCQNIINRGTGYENLVMATIVSIFMLQGPRPCTILCFNVHTTAEYLNTNISIGQLLQHISKSIVVCVRSRPKMLTKIYNKEVYQAS